MLSIRPPQIPYESYTDIAHGYSVATHLRCGDSEISLKIGQFDEVMAYPYTKCCHFWATLYLQNSSGRRRHSHHGAPQQLGYQMGQFHKQCNDGLSEKKHTNFIEPHMWPPNSPDINPVDYAIWGAIQQ